MIRRKREQKSEWVNEILLLIDEEMIEKRRRLKKLKRKKKLFNNGSEEPAKINFSTDDHCKSLLCAASLCWGILELVKVFIAKDLEVKNENINY